MRQLVAVALLVALCCSPIATIDTSHITDSLSLANDLGGFIASQDFSKTATKLISSVSPFLGIIGSVLSFAFSFLNTGPSPELLAIQKLYRDVSLRFDHIDHQFATVTREIKWVSIEAHYGDYESTIHTISHTYQNLAASTSKLEFDSRKYLFIQAFNSYDKAGEKIYDGIVGQSNLFNGPIFDEAINHLSWDRKQAQTFMLGVTKLLINAAAIEIAYYHLTGHHDSARFIQHDWEVKFATLKTKLSLADHKLSTQFYPQLSDDVDNFIIHHDHESNCDVANKLYSDVLAKKYYWRNWSIVVTDHSTDSHKIRAHSCGGTINQKHGKNVIVSSVDPHKAHLTTTEQHVINYVHTYTTFHIMHGGKREIQKRVGHRRVNADDAYNGFPADARSGCKSVYSGIGVIDHSLHTCYKSDRIYKRYDGHYYDVYATG